MTLKSTIIPGEEIYPNFTINEQAPNESLVMEAIRLIPYQDLLDLLEEYTITAGKNTSEAVGDKKMTSFTLILNQQG